MVQDYVLLYLCLVGIRKIRRQEFKIQTPWDRGTKHQQWSSSVKTASSLNTLTHSTIIWCMVPEIWSATDRIFCHSEPFLALLPYYQFKKSKWNKKWKKKSLEISSFYSNVPKFMTICYTIPEIWHVMDVINIFHFELFFAFIPH